MLDSAWAGDSVAWAQVELALHRPDQALRVLGPLADSAPAGLGFVIAAQAAYAAGEFARAAAFFRRAADGTSERDRGVLVARAADAYELAHLTDSAVVLYREAGRLLPLIAGWVRVREARVTLEPVRAFQLLRGVPRETRAAAALVRAPLLLSAGDTARAITAFATGGAFPVATTLALARGDVASAREWLEQSLDHSPSDSLVELVAVLEGEPWPAPTADDLSRLVRLYERVGRPYSALGLIDRWADAFADTLRLLRIRGDLLASSGREREAEASYSMAMQGAGRQAALSEYRRALLLRRLGRTADGWHALEAFTRRWPRAPETPSALFLLGERFRDRGLHGRADSVLRQLVTGWPGSRAASRARVVLAGLALSQRDTAAAIEWYSQESTVRGTERLVAMAQLARLEELRRNTERAADLWRDLSQRDSLGYYGMLARQIMAFDAPNILPVQDEAADPGAARVAEQVNALFAVGFRSELDALVAYHRGAGRSSVAGRQALARALIEHGWPAEGIRIGWQLADTLSLGDARVLRLIYPWPLRTLIEREAAELELDPYLLVGLIRQESAFRPQVTSRAGARGLMQLMPTTASWLAGRLGLEWDDRFLGVADANLHLGAVHLANLLRQYDGNVVFALAAYNAGGTVVNRWRRAMRDVDGTRFVEQIPYAETRGFVQAVLRNAYLYRALYPPQR